MIAIIQDGISQLLNVVGLDEASLKVLICTLLSFPFSAIYKRLPDHRYSLKNWYNVLVSAFYIFGILNLRSGLVTLLISSMGCYVITRYLRTPSMPWVNFLFLMTHMAYSHLHTQFFVEFDPNVIDITGAQMILVIKLSAFGWNVYDGKQPSENLTEYNKSRAIKKHPNLLPYIGYVFFYASLLTGPSFEYADYDRFIHSTLFDDVPDSKRPGKNRKRRIPRSGIPALKKTLQGFGWAFILFQAPKYLSVDFLLSDEFVTEHGFIYRIFYLWAMSFNYRLKYYAIWSIAEGACITCGIGYNGYDPETDTFKWNRVQNIDPIAFETGQNVHVCLEAWNMNTNKWLKNYVYLRVAKKGKRPGFKSTLFTFATSAFWHGTRPGYYLTFVGGAFLQTVGRICRSNFRPIFLEADRKTPKPTKKIYDVVCYIMTQLAFGFYTQPFVLATFRNSLYVWSTVYYYLLIGTFLIIFIFKGPYAKQATKFCKSFHPQPVEAAAAPVVEKVKLDEKKEGKYKLTKEESELVHQHLQVTDLYESPTLGLPPIDYIEKVHKEDIDKEIENLRNAWVSFKGRRHSIGDDDFEGLKDAYNNFKNEINEIYEKQKQELLHNSNNDDTKKQE